MENVVFTQLSIPEVRQLIRTELEDCLAAQKQSPATQPDQILTIEQAAELLCVTVPTVRVYIKSADLPVYRRGKILYFLKQGLIDWLKQGRRKTLAETAVEAERYCTAKKDGTL